jgi:hypothetical protein
MFYCVQVESLATIIQAIFAVPWPTALQALQRSGVAHRGVALLRDACFGR